MRVAEHVVDGSDKRKLPDGWRWVKLGEVCEIVTGNTPPKGESRFYGGTVPWIKPDDLDRSVYVNSSSEYLSEDGLRVARILPTGSVLVSCIGKLGKCAIAAKPLATNQQINSLIPKSGIDSAYLYYACRVLKPELEAAASTSLVPILKKSLFAALPIPLSPLPEQKRIATILSQQMAAVERARAAAENQLEAAKVFPAAYLRAVFNSPEAQRWARMKLGEVCDLLPAKSIATDGDTEVLAITTACLTETGFQASGVKAAKMWAADAAECVVSPGEVLIARSNTPDLVGRVAMFSGDPKGGVASDLTIRIRPRDGLKPPFLTAYLSFLYLTGYWKERAGGASGSMKKITRTQILDERIPLPALPDQHRIVARLSEQMVAAAKARKTLEEQLDTINKLPAALLRRAFSGEL